MFDEIIIPKNSWIWTFPKPNISNLWDLPHYTAATTFWLRAEAPQGFAHTPACPSSQGWKTELTPSCCGWKASLPGQRHDVVWLIFTEAGAQSLTHISTKWLFNVIQCYSMLFIHLHTDHENIKIRYSKSSSCLLMSLLWQLSSLNPQEIPPHRLPRCRTHREAQGAHESRAREAIEEGRNGAQQRPVALLLRLGEEGAGQ